MRTKLQSFFLLYPALLLAFFAVIGMEAFLLQAPYLLLLVVCFWVLYLPDWKLPMLGSVIAASAFLLASSTFQFIPIPEGTTGKAWIQIDHLSHQTGKYGASWIYKGRIKEFSEGEITLREVPFFMSIPEKNTVRPSADKDYIVPCTVKQGRGKSAVLKPLPKCTWEPVDKSSLAEVRFSAKQTVKKWIADRFASPISVSFLSGLIIGEFDDPNLRKDFGRFGLLHILAISGFHFAIFAKLLGLLFRPFLHPRWTSLAIAGLLSVYFFFLGWGPSVVRAWMTILVFLSATLKGRLSSPLNSLGLALLFSTLLDPLLLENLGFQFSFLATAAILLAFNPSLDLLNRLFPKRDLSEVLKWPIFDRFTFLFLGYIKSNFALTLATGITVIPLSLYYFQLFPILSLIYNLFFPTLVSVSMSLLLLGFLLSPFPWIADQIHKTNDYFTSFILNLTSNVPENYDFFLSSPPFSATLLVIFNIIMLIIFIYCRKQDYELNY